MKMDIQNREQWMKEWIESCEEGNVDRLRKVLDRRWNRWADLSAGEWYGFAKACAMGHLEVVRYLLTSPEMKNHGHELINVHVSEDWGLREACLNGQLEVVKYLLTSAELKETEGQWADVHARRDEPFHWALMLKKNSVLRWLIMDFQIDYTQDIERHMKFMDKEQKGILEDWFRSRNEKDMLKQAMEERQEYRGDFKTSGMDHLNLRLDDHEHDKESMDAESGNKDVRGLKPKVRKL